MWDLFLISLIPLVLFVVVDYRSGLRSGVWTAIASSIVLGIFFWWILGELDFEFLLMIVALGVTGFISLRKNNPIYFKFQPVVTNVVGVLFIGWFQFFDTPIMIKYLPKMQRFTSADEFAMLSDPAVRPMLVRMSLFTMIAMIAHSGIVAYAAIKLSNKLWLWAKALGLPFILFSVVGMELLRAVLK